MPRLGYGGSVHHSKTCSRERGVKTIARRDEATQAPGAWGYGEVSDIPGACWPLSEYCTYKQHFQQVRYPACTEAPWHLRRERMLSWACSRWRREALLAPTRFQRRPHCSAGDSSTTHRRASTR